MTDSFIVMSSLQAFPLLRARDEGQQTVATSLDLGRTVIDVPLSPDGVLLPDRQVLLWDVVDHMTSDPDACWLIENGALRKINAFSEQMQRAYSLLATDSAPTLVAAGFTMHRIKRSDPWEDTRNKIKAAAPVRGNVLDVNTGLGYTAIQAAQYADRITTIEIDPTVLEIARLNPWSRELFDNPRIEQIIGDSFEVVDEMPAESFHVVIHDPPTLSLAGELYSGEFYRRLFRVLRPGGHVFHYTGNPEGRQGQTVTRGVVRRLKEAGFTRVVDRREAFGVTAYKSR